MKKLLALTLTMAMLFTMTAMAEDTIKLNGETSKDVTATYKEGTDGGTIYSVDIVWGSMAFTYNAESKGVWKPETHTYTDSAEAEWSCEEGADTIVVTNHSNAAINIEMNYTAAEGFESIIGTLSNPRFELANADGAMENSILTDKSILELSGELAVGVSETKIGEITVTISDTQEKNDDKNEESTNEDFEIISLSANSEAGISNTINVDSSYPLYIYVEGNGFNDSNINTILKRISLKIGQDYNSLNLETEYIDFNVVSENKIEIIIFKEYFDNYFGNMSDFLSIAEIVYTDEYKTIEYTGKKITISKS